MGKMWDSEMVWRHNMNGDDCEKCESRSEGDHWRVSWQIRIMEQGKL